MKLLTNRSYEKIKDDLVIMQEQIDFLWRELFILKHPYKFDLGDEVVYIEFKEERNSDRQDIQKAIFQGIITEREVKGNGIFAKIYTFFSKETGSIPVAEPELYSREETIEIHAKIKIEKKPEKTK